MCCELALGVTLLLSNSFCVVAHLDLKYLDCVYRKLSLCDAIILLRLFWCLQCIRLLSKIAFKIV